MNELILENDLSAIAARASSDPAFLRDLPAHIMRAYKAPEAQIARAVRDNDTRIAKAGSDLIDEPRRDFVWASKIHFSPSKPGQVHETVERLRAEQKPKAVPGKTGPRFLLSSDGDDFAAVDLRTGEAFRGERLADLPAYYDFLQPLAGIERYVPPSEQQADVDAARIMRELHDALVAHDSSWRAPERTEALNVFLTRLLFCLFADGAGVFDAPATTDRPAVVRPFKRLMMGPASAKDGSGTAAVLTAAFRVLDMKDDDPRRHGMEPKVRDLPYANGRLFEADLTVPSFDRRARHALRRALDLDWSGINADIFGSMLQAVASDADRSHFGMHYTSVPNIMKVIGPLFVDRMNERLAKAGHQPRKLRTLLDDLAAIHVFDPACGSGNFLIISYHSLRSIETAALARLKAQQPDLGLRSRIRLDHFHGIDPVDFSCRTARLSLWISQIKADRELVAAGIPADAILPLHDAGDIRCGSALTLPWSDIVSDAIGPTYIVGNPPYLGAKGGAQQVDHKSEMDTIFRGRLITWRNLDYVTAWFALAADHIATYGSQAALVSTNSICQGEQVSSLWPLIRDRGVEIGFAHTGFKWTNSAAHNAGVACVIIGLRKSSQDPKHIYSHRPDGNAIQTAAQHINGYLVDAPDVILASKANDLPTMLWGNMACDGGALILTRDEKASMIAEAPETERFIKRYMGSNDFLNAVERHCIWISDGAEREARSIPTLRARFDRVERARLASPAPTTRARASISHRFLQIQDALKPALLIPRVSSERRHYLQVGFVDNETIITDAAFAIYNAPTWMLALLSTRMHMVWTKAVGGRLKQDVRYANRLVYDTFIPPALDDPRRTVLEECSLRIIDARQPHLDDGRSIAWLYNPETMPEELLAVHDELDEEFESMYVGRRFRDDAERLEHLFRLHARMKGTTK